MSLYGHNVRKVEGRGTMWTVRITALRAASVAALAVGIRTLWWLVKRSGADNDIDSSESLPATSNKVMEVELSPFKTSSEEYSPSAYEDPALSPIGEAQPELDKSPSDASVIESNTGRAAHCLAAQSLHFQDSETSSEDERQKYRGRSAGNSDTDSEYNNGPFTGVWKQAADGVAHLHTPDSQRGAKVSESPKSSFPQVDYEPDQLPHGPGGNGPQRSPYDLSTGSANGHAEQASTSGRHSRVPSFPVVDYEPEHRGGFSSSSQADSFDMAPAPTEEGDAIAKVEEVLADLEEQVELGARRHSRSFSEPNLAARLSEQALQTQKHTDRSSDEDDDYYTQSAERGEAQPAEAPQAGSSSSSAALPNGREHSAATQAAESAKRSRDESEVPPLLRLDILSGPASGRDITIDDASIQVAIGRNADNLLAIEDNEVSGEHVSLHWDSRGRVWQVRDMGSLNGTRLNGNFISNTIRRPGKLHRLNSDDILLLGSRSAIKVIYLPNTSMPDMPQNLKRVYAPPSPLQPTTTLRSEAMASLRAEVGIEKAIQADSLRMQGAVLCRLGVEHQRKGTPCEDVPFWGEPGRFQAALYCVFDGHCGRKTASTCTRLLPEELRKRMGEVRPDLDAGVGAGRVWEEVFLATDAALDTEDGATATAVLVWKDAEGNLCLQTANVGDSAAVFCNSAADPREQFQKLTADHRISDPIEKQRLADLGIELGKNRTRLYGLNLSRCLGDKFIKGADLGFTAVPSISEVAKLAPHESGMLVVASDGLWDVAEPGRVMEVAFEAQRHPCSNPETIADAVYQHAMKQRTKDDVCIFVLCFHAEEGSLPSEKQNGCGSRPGPRLQRLW